MQGWSDKVAKCICVGRKLLENIANKFQGFGLWRSCIVRMDKMKAVDAVYLNFYSIIELEHMKLGTDRCKLRNC